MFLKVLFIFCVINNINSSFEIDNIEYCHEHYSNCNKIIRIFIPDVRKICNTTILLDNVYKSRNFISKTQLEQFLFNTNCTKLWIQTNSSYVIIYNKLTSRSSIITSTANSLNLNTIIISFLLINLL